jgi:hypothetical protein
VDLPRELPVEATALIWHHLPGAVLVAMQHPLRRSVTHPDLDSVPMQHPTLTTRQVRTLASPVFPGARVRGRTDHP